MVPPRLSSVLRQRCVFCESQLEYWRPSVRQIACAMLPGQERRRRSLQNNAVIPIRVQSATIPRGCTHGSQETGCTMDGGMVSDGSPRMRSTEEGGTADQSMDRTRHRRGTDEAGDGRADLATTCALLATKGGQHPHRFRSWLHDVPDAQRHEKIRDGCEVSACAAERAKEGERSIRRDERTVVHAFQRTFPEVPMQSGYVLQRECEDIQRGWSPATVLVRWQRVSRSPCIGWGFEHTNTPKGDHYLFIFLVKQS
jgi:hypothetical protein